MKKYILEILCIIVIIGIIALIAFRPRTAANEESAVADLRAIDRALTTNSDISTLTQAHNSYKFTVNPDCITAVSSDQNAKDFKLEGGEISEAAHGTISCGVK